MWFRMLVSLRKVRLQKVRQFAWNGTARGRSGNQMFSVLSFFLFRAGGTTLNFAFVMSTEKGFVLQE